MLWERHLGEECNVCTVCGTKRYRKNIAWNWTFKLVLEWKRTTSPVGSSLTDTAILLAYTFKCSPSLCAHLVPSFVVTLNSFLTFNFLTSAPFLMFSGTGASWAQVYSVLPSCKGGHSQEAPETACCFPSKLQYMKKLWKQADRLRLVLLMMRRQRKFILSAVSAVVFHLTLEQELPLCTLPLPHHITAAFSFSPGQRLLRVPARQTKITCDLSLPAPLAFFIAPCTHQHTQALKSAESRQNCMSYVVAAQSASKAAKVTAFLPVMLIVHPGKCFWCCYRFYHGDKLPSASASECPVYLLSLMIEGENWWKFSTSPIPGQGWHLMTQQPCRL